MDTSKVKKRASKSSSATKKEKAGGSAKTDESKPARTRSVEEIINALIDGKDGKNEQFMSQCSSQAKEMREKINEFLEQRQAVEAKNPESDDQQNSVAVQKKLEEHIKEKIADLQGALKTANISEQKSLNESSEVPEECDKVKEQLKKEKSPEKIDGELKVNNESDDKENEKEKSQEQQSSVEEISVKDEEERESEKVEVKEDKKKKETGKKEKFSAEQLGKQLANFGTDLERIEYLSQLYTGILQSTKSLTQKIKQQEKVEMRLVKEKDQIQQDYNRVVLAKIRLESLCRELQRQNKVIKEESILKIKEEEEKRREIANKFQGTLNDIMQLIQENQKRNAQLKEENADLASKLKSLMAHYENWEKHTEQVFKQKELENQLVKAKYAKTNIVMNQEKELYTKEKQQLIGIVNELQKRCSDLSASELHLRTELSLYTTKYEEFQNVLSKSNETFSSFKKDIERMSKQIRKLEKETVNWRSKWEASNKALATLAEEKQKRDVEFVEALQKIGTLEKLCRALQTERGQMQEHIKKLKAQQNTGAQASDATEQLTCSVDAVVDQPHHSDE